MTKVLSQLATALLLAVACFLVTGCGDAVESATGAAGDVVGNVKDAAGDAVEGAMDAGKDAMDKTMEALSLIHISEPTRPY